MSLSSNSATIASRLPSAIMLASFLPLVTLHFLGLWEDEHQRHFPFVLLFAAILLHDRWSRNAAPSTHPHVRRAITTTLLTTSFLLLLASVLLWSPWSAMAGAILAVAALLLHGERPAARQWVPAWLLLCLLLPPPFGFDVLMTNWLQTATTHVAGVILDLGGINHMVRGNVVVTPAREFLVEEACSGMHSLFALFALAAIFVVWAGRSIAHSVCLLASAVGWAGATNLVRVVVVVAAYSWWEVDLAHGWRHETTGMVLFATAVFLLLSTDRLLLFFCQFRDGSIQTNPTR